MFRPADRPKVVFHGFPVLERKTLPLQPQLRLNKLPFETLSETKTEASADFVKFFETPVKEHLDLFLAEFKQAKPSQLFYHRFKERLDFLTHKDEEDLLAFIENEEKYPNSSYYFALSCIYNKLEIPKLANAHELAFATAQRELKENPKSDCSRFNLVMTKMAMDGWYNPSSFAELNVALDDIGFIHFENARREVEELSQRKVGSDSDFRLFQDDTNSYWAREKDRQQKMNTISLFCNAAGLGYVPACFELGNIFEVKKRDRWARAALFEMISSGTLKTDDPVSYYSIASANGDPRALYNLEVLYYVKEKEKANDCQLAEQYMNVRLVIHWLVKKNFDTAKDYLKSHPELLNIPISKDCPNLVSYIFLHKKYELLPFLVENFLDFLSEAAYDYFESHNDPASMQVFAKIALLDAQKKPSESPTTVLAQLATNHFPFHFCGDDMKSLNNDFIKLKNTLNQALDIMKNRGKVLSETGCLFSPRYSDTLLSKQHVDLINQVLTKSGKQNCQPESKKWKEQRVFIIAELERMQQSCEQWIETCKVIHDYIVIAAPSVRWHY